jgi:hypothetical protein
VTFTVKFYGDDDLIYKIARGIPISGSRNDPAVQKAKYTMFFVFPSATIPRSYVLQNCITDTPLDLKYGKTFCIEDPITFTARNTDSTVELLYKDTIANCATFLGARSPF